MVEIPFETAGTTYPKPAGTTYPNAAGTIARVKGRKGSINYAKLLKKVLGYLSS